MFYRPWLCGVALALLLVLTGNLWADSTGLRESEMKVIKRPHGGSQIDWEATKSPVTQNKKEAGLLSVRDMIPLLAVLALIFAAAWVVKRFMPGQKLLSASGALQVITRTPLTSKQSLVLVKMGRQLLLLGVSADRITTLSVVDDPEQVAGIVGRAASGQPDSMTRSFADSLAGESEAYRYESHIEDEAVTAGGQVRSLLEKVRRLSGSRGAA
ncbi:MAG: flagellar biosynthetic protein FliO [Planctomycetota bacterium]|jgi:flagellar biosynthetic protein FliO